MIEPIDVSRCQATHKPGTFMTMGPRGWHRCQNVPTIIVVEKEIQEGETELGAMSLCDSCLVKMKEILGKDLANIFEITHGEDRG